MPNGDLVDTTKSSENYTNISDHSNVRAYRVLHLFEQKRF
jgi:hypothetical protein